VARQFCGAPSTARICAKSRRSFGRPASSTPNNSAFGPCDVSRAVVIFELFHQHGFSHAAIAIDQLRAHIFDRPRNRQRSGLAASRVLEMNKSTPAPATCGGASKVIQSRTFGAIRRGSANQNEAPALGHLRLQFDRACPRETQGSCLRRPRPGSTQPYFFEKFSKRNILGVTTQP
jgi:hypothetical protein